MKEVWLTPGAERREQAWVDGGPSFPMRRFFGDLVTQQMGEKNKRWVTDQIIDIEVPEILTTLNRSLPNLFL